MTTYTDRSDRSDRMPPLAPHQMDERQQAAADELIAGPRKAVKGPFIALLRSPELMARMQRVGEYLRFDSVLPARISEFATLIVARRMTQQFEWFVHVPLALKAGTSQATIDALREGRRPHDMDAAETMVHDFVVELLASHGVGDRSYLDCRDAFGERGVVELVSLVGYFQMVSMVLNVAHTPPEVVPGVEALPPLPC
jgi:4-carboxymuconolactone decarboxylase